MRFNRRLLSAALSCCAVSTVVAAEELPSPEFWQWFSLYVDEQGEVFDPLDLAEIENLDPELETSTSDDTATQSESEDPRQHAETTNPTSVTP